MDSKRKGRLIGTGEQTDRHAFDLLEFVEKCICQDYSNN
jgi:hypothetical protein